MNYRLLTMCAPVVLGLVLIGCNTGPAGGTVTGTVRLDDGTIVPVGAVTFHGKDGKTTGTGTIEKTGAYKVTNAPLGTCKVTIFAPPPKDAGPAPKESKDPVGGNIEAVPVPAKYADKDKTDLTFDVKTGSQTFEIVLKK